MTCARRSLGELDVDATNWATFSSGRHGFAPALCQSSWSLETDRIGLANFSDASECELPSNDGRALARSGKPPISQSRRVLEGVQTVIPSMKTW